MRPIKKGYIIALLSSFCHGLTYLLYTEFNRRLELRTLHRSKLALMAGYLLTPVPGAFVVNRYGGVVVLGVSTLLHAGFVLFIDNLTSINFFQLLSIRLFQGVFKSLSCSSTADIWARWWTQHDRSKYISIGLLGPYIFRLGYYWFVGTILMKHQIDPDQKVFRGTAIACVIWAAIWLSLCKNDPSEDKYLSEDERAILQSRLEYLDEKGVSWNQYPWQQMYKSKPFWALIGISFIFGITNDFIYKHLPIFMIITTFQDKDAFLPIVPGIKGAFVALGMLIGAYIVDKFRNHPLYTTTKVHKFIICGGFMVQAILLLIIHFTSPTFKLFAILEASVTLVCMIINFDVCVNVLDLSPRYASLVNGFRCASYMIPRIYNKSYVKEKEEWLAFFIIVSILYAIGALIYFIWGSGEVQPWNNTSSNNSNNVVVIWKSIKEDNEKLID